MSETIMAELYFFLHAVLTGIVLSAVYDVFRIMRRVHTHKWFLIAVEDFLYWIGSALYISYVLMNDNNGIIRWFFILGILLGMVIYNVTISQHLVGILSKTINRLLYVVKKVLNILLKPVVFLWIKSKKIWEKGGNCQKKITKKSKKALKNCYKTIRIGLSKK